MEPTYMGGQFVFVNKLEKEYEQGDIVLYESRALGAVIIKRIAAMPGDAIYIAEGRIYVNDEPYLPFPDSGECDYAGLAAQALNIPEGKCFLLGDNFSRSIDSRHDELGLCDLKNIKGKIK